MSRLETAGRAAAETAAFVADHAQLAYHGLAAWMDQRRQNHAGDVVDRMDHKIELYGHLGAHALHHIEPPAGVRPKSVVEKFVDWRLDRRAAKAIDTRNQIGLAERIYGQERSDYPMSIRQSLIDRALSVPPLRRSVDTPVTTAVKENARAIVLGPDIRGTGPLGMKVKRVVNNYEYVRGRKTARERREDMQQIKGSPAKHGVKTHKWARRKHRRAQERLEFAAEMPITSHWRESKLDRAERRERKMQRKITHHKAKNAAIRAKRSGTTTP